MNELFQLLRSESRGMWRYRWPAIISAWIICLLGWGVVFTLPDIFEARAQVYVDADSRLADVMGEVGVAPGISSQVFVVRQAMLGRPQLERVARETDLDLRARTQEEKQGLIESLREKIGVAAGRRSRDTPEAVNLYTITFSDRDRNMAISVVQTLLDTFVEDVLELKSQDSEDVTVYLEDQLNHYSGLLSEADTALANFKREYVGLLPGDSGGVFERIQSEMDRLKDLQTQLQIQEERRSELRRQLQSEVPYLPEGADSATGAPVSGSATEATIAELETQRATLLLTYTQKHPDVVAIDEQLQQLYQKRDADRAALAASGGGIEGVANATNPVYQSVQIALNETGVQIAGLRSEVNQSEAVVRRLTDQVNTIPEVEAKYAELTRNYDQYKSLYDDLLMRKELERMSDAGDERDVMSFNIIDPPAASFDPVAPRRALLLVGVLIFGLGAGGLIAYVIHQLNPVFHDAKTLREISGRPVLGAVSMTWLERHKLGRRNDFLSFTAASASLITLFVFAILLKDQFTQLVHTLIWQTTG